MTAGRRAAASSAGGVYNGGRPVDPSREEDRPLTEVPTTTPPRRRPALLSLLVLALVAAVAAGCGGDDGAAGAEGDPAQTAPAATTIPLPDDVRATGTLVVATDPTSPPNEFVAPDDGAIVGMDVDLAEAIGEKLGLDVVIERVPFAAILPGVAARRYDLGISSLTVTRARARTVDFVTYFRAGSAFYVRRGARAVRTLADLCGRRVAVARGTTQARDVRRQRGRCRRAGRPPVRLRLHRDQGGVDRALDAGRADVAVADAPVAAHAVARSRGALATSGRPYGIAPYGIAVAPDRGLHEPVLAAVRALIADGTYRSILREWGLERGAIDAPRLVSARG